MPGYWHPATPQPDAAKLKKLHEESAEHLEYLKAGGALGVLRPVSIFGSGAFADGAHLRSLEANEKRVHLIRHGQGFHNLLADVYKRFGKKFDAATGGGGTDNPYLLPEVMDPPLTEVGRSQARGLQAAACTLHPELVIVSPMVRATQTALIGFQHLVEGGKTKIPFVAHEGCHEISGVHVCDKRRAVKELQQDFPMVDYAAAAIADDDPLWNEKDRETPVELATRGYEFLLWLRNRTERDIVVATHSAWLFALLNAVVDCDDELSKRWFDTGEMRSFIFRFVDSKEEPATKRTRIT